MGRKNRQKTNRLADEPTTANTLRALQFIAKRALAGGVLHTDELIPFQRRIERAGTGEERRKIFWEATALVAKRYRYGAGQLLSRLGNVN